MHHIANLRKNRFTQHPDPVRAKFSANLFGLIFIVPSTAHDSKK